jgi:arsenate reductase
MITIWHNSRCGKSRDAIKLLDEKDIKYEVFEYLKQPISTQDIKNLIQMLRISDVREMLRKKEKEYKELDLDSDEKTQDEIIYIVIKNPKLIERPILIKGNKAAIGRPIGNIIELLGV